MSSDRGITRLQRPREPYVLWVEVNEEALYLLEAVLLWEDNMANVRREYRVREGRKWFKVFVTPGYLEEVLGILGELRRWMYVGSVRLEIP